MARKRFGRRWPLGVLLAAVALGAASARADDDHARELFKQGNVYFDLSQYDRAIEVWQRGYQEKQDPGFLYNIAQAYRLWGNPEKAITFYKSFLRNSPKAENRAEVEGKIAALQKQLGEGSAPRTEPSGTAPEPSSAAGVPVASQGLGAPPLGSAVVARPSPTATTATASTVDATNSAPTVSPSPHGPFDLGAAAGAAFWLSGVQGSPGPSVAFAVRGGANLAAAPDATVAFRLGGTVGYSMLSEPAGRVSFVSIMAEPGARFRLGDDRWFLHTSVGVGVVVVAGLKPQSPLLARERQLAVDGTQSLLELRPRAEIECRLSPTVAVSLGPSLAYTPKRTYYYEQWLRLQLMAAFAFSI